MESTTGSHNLSSFTPQLLKLFKAAGYQSIYQHQVMEGLYVLRPSFDAPKVERANHTNWYGKVVKSYPIDCIDLELMLELNHIEDFSFVVSKQFS